MPVNYIPMDASATPMPMSEDFAVGLAFKESTIPFKRRHLNALTAEKRYEYVEDLLGRLRQEHEKQQDVVLNRFTAFYLQPLVDHWLREEDAGSVYFIVLNAIQADPYFQTWLFLNPGKDREILASLAEKMAATQWSDTRRITNIFHLCQMLATMLIFVDSDDALPSNLTSRLLAKIGGWHRLCEREHIPLDEEDLYSPRNSIERAEKLLRRDPGWVARGRDVKAAIEEKMQRCNFGQCTVPYIPGTDNLMQCSKCKTARYCSQEHQRADWRTHKEYCHQPAWL